ncbi:hypothetical protein NDU88_002329 [Pleurodeles waltl]|uniref:Uncharacterized protein n=1 Tax=Pleurodeles waltl TaxID=8319 RepID=A0AAV7KVT2_PLEWA|nr:hypothetical protein NDU88_002329 [Pleurodeles waltl]
MDLQAAKIEMIIKEMERFKDDGEVKELLIKMVTSLQKYDEDNMERKARKCTRDRLDYQYGRVYTFAKKYDFLRSKEKLNVSKSPSPSESDISSDPGSSAAEHIKLWLNFVINLEYQHFG